MTSQTKFILTIFCALAAIWDVVTTFNGMSEYFSNILGGIVATFFINGVLFFAFIRLNNDVLRGIGVILLVVAFIADIYTAYEGNLSLMSETDSDGKKFIAGCLTIITVGATIATSYLYFRAKGIEIIEEDTDGKKKSK